MLNVKETKWLYLDTVAQYIYFFKLQKYHCCNVNMHNIHIAKTQVLSSQQYRPLSRQLPQAKLKTTFSA